MRRSLRWGPAIPALSAYLLIGGLLLVVLDLAGTYLQLSEWWQNWLPYLLLCLMPPSLWLVKRWRSRHSPTGVTLAQGAEPATQGAVFRVGDAEINTATRQLYFSGQAVEVQPKVYDLLVYLLLNRDRAISKDELFDQIWPSVVVSEASLTQTVKRLRDLFRNHGFEQDVVRTVSRTGYQFDYPVTFQPNQSSSGSKKVHVTFPWPEALVSLVMMLGLWMTQERPLEQSVPLSPSLAVLPYSNLSEGGEFSYFARGLTETITDSLSRVSGLKLIALASASNTGESDQDAQAMGDKLGVAQVVTGSVEKIGEQVRVHTRLVRVADGKSLWSAVHERQVDNVFAIHDEISQFIVSRLSELMAEQYQLPGSPSAGTVTQQDSSAYLLVLQANALRQGGSGQQLAEAQQLYRQALQLKPDYPQALIGLAAVIRARTTLGDIPREAGFPEALSLARRAVLLAPDLADAFVQIGEIQYRHFWDFKQADASFQQALAAAPGSATAHAAYGRFLSKVGRHRAAIQQARTALELDPLSPGALASLIIRLIRVDELDQARQLLEQMKQRYPGDANIPWLETNWHIRHQSYNEALQWIALEELAYLRQSLSAMALHFLDRKGQAQKTLDELIATDAEGAAFQIAEVYAQWQQLDLAFVWLDKAFSQGDPGLSELYSSVNLHNLYEDERFFALAARLGLPVLSAQALRQP